MKRKILFLTLLLILALLIFTNPANAYTEYSDKICYEENQFGTISVMANPKNASKLTELKVEDIPPLINNKPVSDIAAYGFSSCTALKKVEIGVHIKYIGQYGFFNCVNLTDITLPSRLDSVQSYTFEDCKSLRSIVIPSTVAWIQPEAFKNCTSLESIVLPGNLKTIDSEAFMNCKSLKSIEIPNAVMNTGTDVFSNCTSLTTVVLPDYLGVIQGGLFYNCISLKNVEMPAKMKAILSVSGPYGSQVQKGAFEGCTSLESIKLKGEIIKIEGSAFARCPNLKSIYFPENVKQIDSGIFVSKLSPYDRATDTSKITFYGFKDTEAESFANSKGIKFVLSGFTDVKKSDWFYSAADFCSSNGIITGYKDGSFAPNDSLTRGMIVSILYKMEGQPSVSGDMPFSDVPSAEYYYRAVMWASKNKIVSGYGEGKFAPNDNIKRQDLAVILYKYAKYKGKDVSKTNNLYDFTDIDKIDNYAMPQLKWAVGAGVITGNKDRTLNPQGESTRAEAAAMMEKYCKQVGR